MNKRIYLYLCGLLLMVPDAYAASSLTPEQVLGSARAHYPEIYAAKSAVQAKQADIQSANGAFDMRVEGEFSGRPAGFYGGHVMESRVVKPLEAFNASIYGGYRISDGSFPVYEDEYATNSGGEFSLGGELSLLRDRLIDKRRAGVKKAEIDADISALKLTMTRLKVHQQALLSYWEWVSAGQYLTVLQEMNTLSVKREKGLKERYKRGDIAKILLTEARQHVLKTESRILEQRRILDSAANRLSLYYRDSDGVPVVPEKASLPKAFPRIEAVEDRIHVMAAIRSNPDIAIMYRHVSLEKQAVRLGENALLPKAAISLKLSEDLGAGSVTRDGTEAKIDLKVSIPLQRRAGEGAIRSAQANINRLEYDIALKEDKLRQVLHNHFIALDTYVKDIGLNKEAIALAKRMQQAETLRFSKGDSDFFLVNVRDEALANTRIKYISAQLKYRMTLTDIHALTLNTAALMVSE